MYKTKQLHYGSCILVLCAAFFCGKSAYAAYPPTRVDRITAVKTTAISDGTYDNGFKWLLDVTVPDSENLVSMKFSDLVYGSSSIPIAGNIKYFSKQALDAKDIEHANLVNKKDIYEGSLTIDPSLDLVKETYGIQVKIEVYMAVSKGATPGMYTLPYGIKTIDNSPPIISINDYNTALTRENVIVSATVNKGKLATSSYEFLENGSFTFEAKDDLGNKASTTVTIKNIDRIPPIIRLNGSSSVVVERYSNYRDLSINFRDNNPGSKAEANFSDIKLDVVGDYELRFKVTDVAGNVATATRLISVRDTTPPVISVLPYNTLPTNFDVPVNIMVSGGTSSITSHLFTENGTYTFEAIDDVGNKASATVVVTNIDKEAPVITILGPKEVQMERGEAINLTFSAEVTDNNPIDKSDFIKDVSDVLGNFRNVGDYCVWYRVMDAAGNDAESKCLLVQIRDTKAPIITISDYEKNPTNNSITVYASTNEGVLNADNHIFIDNGSFDFVANDGYGHITTSTVSITNIDRVAPQVKLLGSDIITHEKGENFNDPFVKVTDNNLIDEKLAVSADYSKINTNTIGDYEITYTARDVAGNISDTVTRIVKVRDTKGPIITFSDFDNKTPINKSVVVYALINEGYFTSKSPTSAEPRKTQWTFSESRRKHDFVAVDEYGNYSTSTLEFNNIDTKQPVVTLLGDTTYVIEKGASFTDPGYSCVDNVACDPNNQKPYNIDTSKVTGSNPILISYTVKDTAGNSATSQTRTINIIDTLPPVITLDTYPTNIVSNDIAVTAHINEGTFLSDSSHIFTENGEYVFRAVDEMGFTSELKVVISNIDKSIPSAMTLQDLISTKIETEEITTP